MRAKELLKGFLRHENDAVRLKAIEALGRIGGEDVIQIIHPMLASSVFEEKLVAARALAAIGVDGIAALRISEPNSDEVTKAIAWQVLEECGAMKEGL